MKKVIKSFCIMLAMITFSQAASMAQSKHRIPSIGENIVFSPVAKEKRIIHTGYDCFYSEDLVYKGGFKFKKNYRFRKNEEQLTPLSEIEDYTFLVRDVKTIVHANKLQLLIYLTRSGDEEKVILNLPLEGNSKNNFLTNVLLDINQYSNVVRVSVPYINADSLRMYKECYIQKEVMLYNKQVENGRQLEWGYLNNIAKINGKDRKVSKETVYRLVDIGFASYSKKTFREEPTAKLESENGEILYIPLTYYPSENSNEMCYPFSSLFITKEELERIEYEKEIEKSQKINKLKEEFGEQYGAILQGYNDKDLDRFRKLRTKYGNQNALSILHGRFYIGWTKDMVIESIGKPNDINRSVGSWGVHEQWVYGTDISHTKYLYFENGKLTSFQE